MSGRSPLSRLLRDFQERAQVLELGDELGGEIFGTAVATLMAAFQTEVRSCGSPLDEALARFLALLFHRGLARNHSELGRRALERLPGLRPTVQIGGHHLLDQGSGRIVRRDHPMQ